MTDTTTDIMAAVGAMDAALAQPAMPITESRAEWLGWRRTGIGGSDVAAILGLSPWGTPWSVWADKCVDRDDAAPSNAMDFGLRVETLLADWFYEHTGHPVTDRQARAEHRDAPWRHATLDGMTDGAVFESKATADRPDAWADGPPIYYACQAQWAMHVTGTDRCEFAVLHLAYGRPDIRRYTVHADPADAAFLVDTVDRFWHDHVVTGHPPATDGRPATFDAIADTYPYGDDPATTLDATPDIVALVNELRDLKADAADRKERIAALTNEVRATLGNHRTLVDGVDDRGRPIVIATWNPQDAARFDVIAFRDRYPHTAARFTNTDTTRVLRIKRPRNLKGTP